MKIHPAVHVAWVSTLIGFFTQISFISDLIEKLYDKTAWLRDLLKWESKKKKHKRRKK